MKTINCKQILLTHKGDKMVAEDGGDVVLGTILSNVMAGRVSNPTLGWILGKKFATQDTVDLKAEEVVFVKNEVISICGKEIGQWLSGLIAGQVIEILESRDEIPGTALDADGNVAKPQNTAKPE